MNVQNPGGEPPAGAPTDGQPAGPVTPPGESQPSQGSEITLESLSAKLDALEQQFGNRQSAKDKGVEAAKADAAAARSEVSALQEQLARYDQLKEGGMTSEDAQFRMRMENFMTSMAGPSGIEQPPGAAPLQVAPSSEAQAVLSATGLSPEDPEVTAILGQPGDPTTALVHLANRRKVNPNPATIMPGGGGPAKPSPELWDQYQKEVVPARGNLREVSRIQAKYRALGLEV